MKILQFLLFITLFSSIYFGMNSFVIHRIWAYSGFPKSSLSTLIILTFVFLFPLSMLLARTLPYSPILKYLYWFSTVIMGIISIAIGIILITELIKFLLPHSLINPLQRISLVLIFLFSIYALIQGQKIQIEKITIEIKNLKKPISIVHLSDIHLGMLINQNYSKKIVTLINALDYDFAVITGDLFDGSRHPATQCIEPFNNLDKAIYFASGNHDMYEGLEHVASVLKGSNIRYLKNESISIHGIELMGIDNPAEEFRKNNHIPNHLPQYTDLPSVLLFHPPSHLDIAEKKGIDLQLSGHTHYGQIWPFNYIVKLAFKHGFGLIKYGNMQVYTSPGTGTWGPPMRLGSKNAITLIELIPEA